MTDFRRTKDTYPEAMRTQLWPLCCGAQIISGFKNVGKQSAAELAAEIEKLIDTSIPDHQVYAGEQMMPGVCFLTLNGTQMSSKTITDAVKLAGFVQFGQGTDRNGGQGFWVRNKKGSFKLVHKGEFVALDKPEVPVAA